MKLSNLSISKLRDGGLLVDAEPFFPPRHIAWPEGYPVFKPQSVAGNCIPGAKYLAEIGDSGIKTDAPQIVIWYGSGK